MCVNPPRFSCRSLIFRSRCNSRRSESNHWPCFQTGRGANAKRRWQWHAGCVMKGLETGMEPHPQAGVRAAPSGATVTRRAARTVRLRPPLKWTPAHHRPSAPGGCVPTASLRRPAVQAGNGGSREPGLAPARVPGDFRIGPPTGKSRSADAPPDPGQPVRWALPDSPARPSCSCWVTFCVRWRTPMPKMRQGLRQEQEKYTASWGHQTMLRSATANGGGDP